MVDRTGATDPVRSSDPPSVFAAFWFRGKVGVFPAGYGTVITKVPAAKRSQFTDVALPGPTASYATFDGGDDLAIPAGASTASWWSGPRATSIDIVF